nr:uncharacterized protein DDB_G0283357-like [Ipomoea batatas]GMD08935.1 uncharacterized protein DDB_G0283357-like [Ipomoea batatas]
MLVDERLLNIVGGVKLRWLLAHRRNGGLLLVVREFSAVFRLDSPKSPLVIGALPEMEGVGARLGRSSTRYGPATVFTGPVRKWKKRWVHVTPPNSGNVNQNHQQATANGGVNGNNGSHLLLLKWTPITARQNNNNGNNSNGGVDKNDDSKSSAKDDDVAVEEPRKRKFKYIPIAVLEEQKNESIEDAECEAKPIETETDVGQPTSKADGSDEKPNINDATMEENQAPEGSNPQGHNTNESTLDLSLGLAGDGENDLLKDESEEMKES